MTGDWTSDAVPGSAWDASHLDGFELEIYNAGAPDNDSPDPVLANPLTLSSANVAVAAAGGGLTTGGTTDAAGQWAGTILFQFVIPPFSNNDTWLSFDLEPDRTATARLCQFFTTAGCIPNATEVATFEGVFFFITAVDITVSPDPVDFGDVAVGASAQRTVTITNNTPDFALAMDDATSLSPPFDFRTDNCSGQFVPPGQSCNLVVKFQPTAPGQYSDQFLFDPSPSDGLVAVDLTGTSMQPDTDGDGIRNTSDNCTLVPNPHQLDADADSFGNACDTDLNNDCISNAIDLGQFKSVFFSTDPEADFNGDGQVNALDLGIFKSRFFSAPGPSGLTSDCR